ncbi:MAG: hypothetical protein WBN03_04955 [Desulfobacterales bacterium]
MNKGRTITHEERGCISKCIFQHWGEPQKTGDLEKRDNDYEKCLNDCRICG